MFTWFRPDPLVTLRKSYYSKLEQALLAQRRGKVAIYKRLNEEAETLALAIESAQKQMACYGKS